MNPEMVPKVYIVLFIVILLGLYFLIKPYSEAAQAQALLWHTPIKLPDTSGWSWFPDLAVDRSGHVHIVWCGDDDKVYYSFWDGSAWAAPNDIVWPSQFIHRNALTIGQTDNLLLVFREGLGGGYGLYFTSAPAKQAWSASSWSPPRLVSAQLHVYMADMGIDHKGTLHLLFDDMGNPEGDFCLGGCADIYYRHSKDEGQSWSTPLNLSQSPTGSSREQLKIDAQGALYVTWDEGWDRLSGVGAPIYSVYRASLDGGISWSAPLTITYPTTGTAQLTAGADGQGGVLLVWRNTELDDLFYQWSTDYGQSWSNPASVPGIFARPWTIPFDLYDMATDSAGIIHLLAVGRQSPEENAPLGLYHLSWDGHSWSAPNCVFCGFGFPEYPRLVISEGNHLHAVWFVRDYLWELGNYEVWYSESYSQAPQQTPIPLPTPTLTPTQTIIPPATPSPTPTFPPLSSDTTGIPEGLKTESDDVLQLLVAIAPLALILTVMFILRRSR